MARGIIVYRLLVIGLAVFLSFPQIGCAMQNDSQISGDTQEQNKQEDPYAWDFGEVKQGEIIKHGFELKNESQKVLNIKDINTSCGCTASNVKKTTLLPGESTFIDVQFNTAGYSGLTQQYVYVNTDDLDNPILRFIIKANVVKQPDLNKGGG